MNHPKVRFLTDYKKDIESFFGFVMDANFDDGRNLEWAICKKYPACKGWFSGKKLLASRRDVTRFIFEKHEKNKERVNRNMARYEKNWRLVENDFFRLIQKIFGNHPWPKGKYAAYPTIWGMFPRFLEDKTFQVPWRFRGRRYINVIIAHEMLHFLFFDYFFRRFPKYKADAYVMRSWHISEIFNTLVQNSPSWMEVFREKTLAYPEHTKIIKNISRHIPDPAAVSVDDLVKSIEKGLVNSRM